MTPPRLDSPPRNLALLLAAAFIVVTACNICEHMGAGAHGFTELALYFNRRADGISIAARNQDATAVLQATSSTLQTCTSCHATYRLEVVDAATWLARTGSMHDPSMMHGGH
jgi:hypothetical protein